MQLSTFFLQLFEHIINQSKIIFWVTLFLSVFLLVLMHILKVNFISKILNSFKDSKYLISIKKLKTRRKTKSELSRARQRSPMSSVFSFICLNYASRPSEYNK